MFLRDNSDISRDPFFALVEDFSLDGNISQEEFLLLQEEFSRKKDFIAALEVLPPRLKKLFEVHIGFVLGGENSQKQHSFETEYGSEIASLQKRNINFVPVISFVAKSYYKTPGKYRNFESPKRRMSRSFKLALLKLLRTKLGNIDIESILRRFEECENFEDYFFLLYQLLEVVNERKETKEAFSLEEEEEEIQKDIFDAEQTKKKIIEGESLVVKISQLFARGDKKEEDAQGEEFLKKYLADDTDIL